MAAFHAVSECYPAVFLNGVSGVVDLSTRISILPVAPAHCNLGKLSPGAINLLIFFYAAGNFANISEQYAKLRVDFSRRGVWSEQC